MAIPTSYLGLWQRDKRTPAHDSTNSRWQGLGATAEGRITGLVSNGDASGGSSAGVGGDLGGGESR